MVETERLRLRPWTERDFPDFARYYSDEDEARYVGGKKTLEEAWRHFALQLGHWQLKGFGYWAVDEKDSDSFVGCAGLWQSPSWPEMELGYWLLKDHRAKGYALEACRRCVAFAQETIGAKSLVSYIDPNNLASIRLAKRLGARYESTIDLATYGPHRVYRHF